MRDVRQQTYSLGAVSSVSLFRQQGSDCPRGRLAVELNLAVGTSSQMTLPQASPGVQEFSCQHSKTRVTRGESASTSQRAGTD